MYETILGLYVLLGGLGAWLVSQGELTIWKVTFTRGRPALVAGLLLMGSFPMMGLVSLIYLLAHFASLAQSGGILGELLLMLLGIHVVEAMPWIELTVLGGMAGAGLVSALIGCPFAEQGQLFRSLLTPLTRCLSRQLPNALAFQSLWLQSRQHKGH